MRHPQLYVASVLEEQCARVKAWAQLVVKQGFVVKAEPASSLTGEGKVPENFGISSSGVHGREELRGSLATRGRVAQAPHSRR